MMKSNHHRNFTGSIDDLLKHANNIDADLVERELSETDGVGLPDEDHYDEIMEDFQCSKEEAIEILQSMKEEEAKEALNDMVEKGLLEIVGYDSDGEPKYLSTELGRKAAEEERKRREG